MPYLKTQKGIDWYYETEGQGPVLIFLHGWGVDHRIWRQQIKHFSQRFKVLSLDWPGHGKSSWQELQLQGLVHELEEILERLNVQNCCIVASSFGGLVALKLFPLIKEKIQKLVLVGTLPKFVNSDGYRYGLEMGHVEKLAKQLDTDYPAIVNIFFRSLFTIEERQSRRFKWLQRFRQNVLLPKKEALQNFLDILIQEDVRDLLKDMDIQTHWMTGEHDYICRKSSVETLQKLFKNVQVDFFLGCGHFPFLTKPHEFNQVVEDFL